MQYVLRRQQTAKGSGTKKYKNARDDDDNNDEATTESR